MTTLHVDIGTRKWLACNYLVTLLFPTITPQVSMVYNTSLDDSSVIYPKLLDNDVAVLIYSGNTDSSVNWQDTNKWIADLIDEELLEIEDDWRQWYVDGQVAGAVTYYKNGMAFVTVNGAGHMVPQWRREQAHIMFSYFLKRDPLPPPPS